MPKISSLIVSAALALATAFTPGAAAVAKALICKDPVGRVINCPTPGPARLHQCRDVKTKKFAPCGPGAEPMPLRHWP